MSAETVAMMAEIQGLYQVPVDLFSERFGCRAVLHADVVVEMNMAFHRFYFGGGGEDELNPISRNEW